jgi:hypothetical protein
MRLEPIFFKLIDIVIYPMRLRIVQNHAIVEETYRIRPKRNVTN